MSSYYSGTNIGFPLSNSVEQPYSGDCTLNGKYTIDMDREQLYKYFDSVKVPTERKPAAKRNDNCVIHSLIKHKK